MTTKSNLWRATIAGLLVLFALSPTLFLAGCGASGGGTAASDLPALAEQIDTDDSEERVVELLGQPDRKSESPQGEEWHYESTVKDENGAAAKLKVRVVIKDGSVVGVSRSRSPIR